MINDNDRSQVDRGISPKKPKPKPAASLATLAAPHGSHRFIVCACVAAWSPSRAVCHHTWSPLQAGCHLCDTARFQFCCTTTFQNKVSSAFEKLTLCPPFRTHASSFSWLHPSINFTMFCCEKLIFLLNWDNHGFGKLCPKGLDTLEIKRFRGASGPTCGGNGARPCRAEVR